MRVSSVLSSVNTRRVITNPDFKFSSQTLDEAKNLIWNVLDLFNSVQNMSRFTKRCIEEKSSVINLIKKMYQLLEKRCTLGAESKREGMCTVYRDVCYNSEWDSERGIEMDVELWFIRRRKYCFSLQHANRVWVHPSFAIFLPFTAQRTAPSNPTFHGTVLFHAISQSDWLLPLLFACQHFYTFIQSHVARVYCRHSSYSSTRYDAQYFHIVQQTPFNWLL